MESFESRPSRREGRWHEGESWGLAERKVLEEEQALHSYSRVIIFPYRMVVNRRQL